MKRYVIGIAASVLAVGALLFAATPAEAAPRHGHHSHHHHHGHRSWGSYHYGHSYAPYRGYYRAPYYSGYRYPGYYYRGYPGYNYGYPQSGFGIQTPNFGFWYRR